MRTVYIPLAECYAQIVNTLKPYVGVVAEIADHRPVLESILDQYFYGRCVGQYDEHTHLTQFSLPTELTHEVLQRITHQILRMIQTGFQVMYPSRHYTYTFLAGDLKIEETETYVPRLVASVQKDDEVFNDDDGYIPERLRR